MKINAFSKKNIFTSVGPKQHHYLPAMDHNRPSITSISGRRISHKGDQRQCMKWNTMIGPGCKMILIHCTLYGSHFLFHSALEIEKKSAMKICEIVVSIFVLTEIFFFNLCSFSAVACCWVTIWAKIPKQNFFLSS